MTQPDPLAVLTPEQRDLYTDLTFPYVLTNDPWKLRHAAAAELLRLATRVRELEREMSSFTDYRRDPVNQPENMR